MNPLTRAMRTQVSTFVITFLFIGLLGVSGLASTANGSSETTERQVTTIVKFSSDVTNPEEHARKIASEYDGTVNYVYTKALRGMAMEVPQQHLDRLLENQSVTLASMERRYQLQGHPSHSSTIQLQDQGTSQRTPVGMERINADQVTGQSSHADVNVAVLDTGIDRDHPDLQNNIKGGVNFTTGRRSQWDDGHFHGTHVAGTIAAQDNGRGVVGVAPEANLYSVRVLNPEGKGGGGGIIKGIDWVANNAKHPDIQVANMSLGGPALGRLVGVEPLGDAIRNAIDQGTAFVVAAGNSSMPSKLYTPAGYEFTTTVTAINPRDDKFASFSNFDWFTTVITAPGVKILSTVPEDYEGKHQDRIDGRYSKLNGTSMASPHVAGAMALLFGENPSLSPQEADQVLRKKGISKQWKGDWNYIGDYEPLIDAKEAASGTNSSTTQP